MSTIPPQLNLCTATRLVLRAGQYSVVAYLQTSTVLLPAPPLGTQIWTPPECKGECVSVLGGARKMEYNVWELCTHLQPSLNTHIGTAKTTLPVLLILDSMLAVWHGYISTMNHKSQYMLRSEWTTEVPSTALTLCSVYRNAECGLCCIWNKHDDIIGPTISNSPTKHKLCKLLEAHCHQSSTVMLLTVHFHYSEYKDGRWWYTDTLVHWYTDKRTDYFV